MDKWLDEHRKVKLPPPVEGEIDDPLPNGPTPVPIAKSLDDPRML